jgi:hypothetical protein
MVLHILIKIYYKVLIYMIVGARHSFSKGRQDLWFTRWACSPGVNIFPSSEKLKF